MTITTPRAILILSNTELLALVSATAAGSGREDTHALATSEVTRRQADDDDLRERILDAFHNGHASHAMGRPRPACPYAAQGWDDRQNSGRQPGTPALSAA